MNNGFSDLFNDLMYQADMDFGNQDGHLSWDEVAGALELDATMWGPDFDWANDEFFLTDHFSNTYDENWDGGLDMHEVMKFVGDLGLEASQEDLDMGFDHYDWNGDGLLELWEQDEFWHELKYGEGLFEEDWDHYYDDWYHDDWYYDCWDCYYDDWYYDPLDEIYMHAWGILDAADDLWWDQYYDDWWCWDCYYDDWYYDDWC